MYSKMGKEFTPPDKVAPKTNQDAQQQLFTYDPVTGEWIPVDSSKLEEHSQLIAGVPLYKWDDMLEESKDSSDHDDLEEWNQNKEYQSLIKSKLDELYDRRGYSEHRMITEEKFLRNSVKSMDRKESVD